MGTGQKEKPMGTGQRSQWGQERIGARGFVGGRSGPARTTEENVKVSGSTKRDRVSTPGEVGVGGRSSGTNFEKRSPGTRCGKKKREANGDRSDFQVRNKILATLWSNKLRGAVLLTPKQQRSFVQRQPETFAPVPGGWGRRGSTNVDLKSVGEADAKEALAAAWRNKAPKELIKLLEE